MQLSTGKEILNHVQQYKMEQFGPEVEATGSNDMIWFNFVTGSNLLSFLKSLAHITITRIKGKQGFYHDIYKTPGSPKPFPNVLI